MVNVAELKAALRLVTLGDVDVSVTYYMVGRPGDVRFSYENKHHDVVSELLLSYKMGIFVEWRTFPYDDRLYARIQADVFTS